ncbi:thioredoxin family protein [Taibaiella soli]|uniref:Thioredoxin family protein n=1 Tax=Taibaiella soli TaxID=1649169 RepID=A0A2W2BE72_9BACT|nr:thioredoxin family protein [Taibaiella soli]PZF74187.1 thioredoxin family protein [Taibaiella soli]
MNHFSKATQYYNYAEFLHLIETLMAEGKTTGNNQSEQYQFYTKLNFQRMQRWNKTFHLTESFAEQLKNQPQQTWWVITEGWCGDSAQNLPGIAKMAAASEGKIELRIVLRDEHPEIMDQYLTNGSRSIPKLVSLDLDGNEVFQWGPRPATAQELMMAWKKNPEGKDFETFEKELHTWYTQNKGIELQGEIAALMPVKIMATL